MQKPKRKIISTALLAFAGANFLSGCSEPEQTPQDAYCVNRDNVVVDERHCDDDDKDGYSNGGGLFIFSTGFYGGGHHAGTRLPVDRRTSSFPITDRTARKNAGLPEAGATKPGTRVNAGFGNTNVSGNPNASKGG